MSSCLWSVQTSLSCNVSENAYDIHVRNCLLLERALQNKLSGRVFMTVLCLQVQVAGQDRKATLVLAVSVVNGDLVDLQASPDDPAPLVSFTLSF